MSWFLGNKGHIGLKTHESFLEDKIAGMSVWEHRLELGARILKFTTIDLAATDRLSGTISGVGVQIK
jgi:hypothetical protein